MKTGFYSLIVLLFSFIQPVAAQISFTNGKHSLEISGGISAYYNHRLIKPDATNQNMNKNRFGLRDAQLQIEGRYGQMWEYELQVDFADFASSSVGEADPENPGLMDAYVLFKGLKFVDIQFGYGKTPYSRSSLVPFIYSPYWQRAEIVRGNVFSRRDVGITLSKSFWKQRIGVYAGAYNGTGEISLRGDNDASGALEYIGRVEFAFPQRMRYRDIDERHVHIPLFAIGLNGRFTERKLPAGATFPAYSTGEYGIKLIDGRRFVYGLDAVFMYKGFSGSFEIHQLRGEPRNPGSLLFQGYSEAETKGYFLAGGYVAQLNYFSRFLQSIFSVRYEQLDLNDLVNGRSERFSCAYAFQLKRFNSMLKFQYTKIIKEESIDPLRWTDQFRIGWQYLFK